MGLDSTVGAARTMPAVTITEIDTDCWSLVKSVAICGDNLGIVSRGEMVVAGFRGAPVTVTGHWGRGRHRI